MAFLLLWAPRFSCFPFWLFCSVSFKSQCSLRLFFKASFLIPHLPEGTSFISVALGWHLFAINISAVVSSLMPILRSKNFHRHLKFKLSEKKLRISELAHHLCLSNCTMVSPTACARNLKVILTLPFFTLCHVWTRNRFCCSYLLNITSILLLFLISTTTMIQTTPTLFFG